MLQVINTSPGNLAPVFEAVLTKALRLCDAAFGFLDLYDGSRFRRAAALGVPEPLKTFRAEHQQVEGPQGPGKIREQILAGENVVRELDLKDDESYRTGEPNRHAAVDLGLL